MSELLFSIVIPLYNKGLHIERAVHSVLDQTCTDFELIIIDDGSTDGGSEVVKGITDPRIILIRQENAGVSTARNRGIEAARAELVAFLDADDEWQPTFLETILRLRSKHPDAGLYATAYEIVTTDGKQRAPKFREIPSQPWEGILPCYFRAAALGEPPVCASAVCIPKEIIMAVGGFPSGKRMGEDLDLWGRIALHYLVVFSRLIGATYHHNASNRASSKFEYQDEHPFIDTAAMASCIGGGSDRKQNLDLYIARLKLENARQHVLAGNFKRARQLMSGCQANPSRIRTFLWASRLNYLTYVIWKLKSKITHYSAENY